MTDLELEKEKALALSLSLEEEEEKKNFAPTQEEMDQARAAEEPSTMEAISAGFVEGMPFLKDAVAAYDGIAEAVNEGSSLEGAYNSYKENMNDINQDLTNVKENSPYAFGGGEIAGTVAAFSAGGAALKGAGAGATLTPLGMGITTGAGVGAASNLSQSRNRTASDAVVGAGIGVASEIGGRYIVNAVKKGGKYLMDKADDVGAKAVKRILGMNNVTGNKSLETHLKRTSQKESDFLKNVLTKKMKNSDEMVIDFADKPERMLDKISVKKQELGEELGNLYKKVDKEHKVEIDVHKLKESLKEDVLSSFYNSDDPGMQSIGSKLEKYIDKIGQRSKGFKKEMTDKDGLKVIEEVVQDEKWTLTQAHQLQKDIRNRIKKIYKAGGLDMSAAKEQQKRVATSLGKHMDDILETVSDPSDSVFKAVKQKRIDFGNLAEVGDTLEKEIYRAVDNPMSLVKDALTFRSMAISGMATAKFGPVGLLAGPAINRVVNSPKTPLYLASGMARIGQIMEAAPQGRIATKLNSAALLNSDKFQETVYGIVGEINLSSVPVKREAADIIKRQKDIRYYLKSNVPSMVKDFDEAVDSEDPSVIGGFMDGLSKVPGASKFFEPGVGFDGKVYSEEDKVMLHGQLNEKKGSIPAAQRIALKEALDKSGIIPDFNTVVQAPPKTHEARTKKMPNY